MSDTVQIFNDAISAVNNRDLKRAEELFRGIIKTDESHIAALNLLVVVLMSMKRFAEAEQFIARATSLNQQSDVSFYNYGLISKHLNKPQQALENFSKAIALNPDIAETWNNRGTVLNDLNKYDLAISDFDKAIAINGQYSEAYANKGKSLMLLQRYDEALAPYDKALAIKPGLEVAWLGRGNVFWSLQRYDEALAPYDKALAIKPDLENAWLGRGHVFYDLKRYAEAFAAYDKALSIKPDLENAWLGRGNVFCGLKRYDEAFAAYDKALSIKPDLETAWLGRGNVFCDLKRYDEAFAAYDKALSIKPDLAEAWLAHGTLRLTLGELESGWEKYEYRWKTQQVWKRNFSQPLWLGDSDIKDKTILLHAEQGLGDTLLACRYVPKVAALGAHVILEVQSSLKSLLGGLQGVSMLIGRGDPIPQFDVQCPLMSLPLAFQTTIATIPNMVPYMAVRDNAVEKWRSKLSTQKLKVGIAWAGNPDFGGDRDRSILLQNILRVTRIGGIKYF